MKLCLLSKLLTVTPILKLPGAGESGEHEYQQANRPPRGGHASTACAFSHSSSRSAKPFNPPLIRRVMVLN
ncbi:hypothetical protein SRM1_02066 [Pseudomonas fluorescens]|nr:hypothetical protein SRM1_02066 [Pseudomonas fluorescens]